MFDKVKERGAEVVILNLLNPKLKGFGKARDVKLSIKEKSAFIEIELTGEQHPIDLKITGIRVEQHDDQYRLFADEVYSSKQWIKEGVENLTVNGKIKIPNDVAKHIVNFF